MTSLYLSIAACLAVLIGFAGMMSQSCAASGANAIRTLTTVLSAVAILALIAAIAVGWNQRVHQSVFLFGVIAAAGAALLFFLGFLSCVA